MDILNFIKQSNTSSYSSVLYDKSIYIEKEPLEKLHKNLINIQIDQEELEGVIKLIEQKRIKQTEEINQIQSLLIKISLPIWETLYY